MVAKDGWKVAMTVSGMVFETDVEVVVLTVGETAASKVAAKVLIVVVH